MKSLHWKPVPERRTTPFQSQVASPQFRIDFKDALQDPLGFTFFDPPKPSPILAQPVKQQGNLHAQLQRLSPILTLRFLALAQMFHTFILVLMVVGLLYWSWRLNSNVSYYSNYADPYLQQAMDHGLSIFRHVDNSSASLEHVMKEADTMSTASVPAMMNAVNQSVRIVSRLEHLTYNPTIKMSLG